ncbi:hypothetical protein M407DRAFT_18576 [Tulasnella calospora MUT 4182]|uniref:Uncharacterized protein n=1 Tax=Tulasnella calospora MUT 4182 TaxID=1051891 RepID=A0A0C3QV91_9AGAM|nr:hypothetical protein M407DRAFT_18576 [Tulasnella calospora MUT 4182]
MGGLFLQKQVKISRHLKPVYVPFWVEPRLITRKFVLPHVFYEDPIRGTLLLARRNKNEAYPLDRKDSPSLDPSRCTGVWFRPSKKIARQLKAVETDMVGVCERIRAGAEVADDMPLAGYLRQQVWDHFLYALATPTRTFGSFEKPFPLLSISEPHMQNALANKALGRSYKTGALFCQGMVAPVQSSSGSGNSQSSTKSAKVSKRPSREGRSVFRIMSSDEEEDAEGQNDSDSSEDDASSSDSEEPGSTRDQVLWNFGKVAAASESARGRHGSYSSTSESLKRLRELRAANEKRSGRSTEADEAATQADIHNPQPLDEDDAIGQRSLTCLPVPTTRNGSIPKHQEQILISREMAEAMHLDEEDIDGVELTGIEADDGFSSIQGGLLRGLNGILPRSSDPGVENLFGDHDSSEEEFFGSITAADDDLSDWMPNWT